MIIVTGASGFLGRYVVDLLARRGDRVLACGRDRQQAAFFADLGVPLIPLDVTRPEAFEQLPGEGVKAFVHLAAVIPAAVTDVNTDLFLKVNTLGTFYALEYCRRRAIPRFVFSTTLYEGMEHAVLPVTESMGRNFALTGDHAAYVISKAAAGDLVEHYSREHGLQGIILRLTGLLGYGRQEGYFAGGVFHPSAFEVFYRRAHAGLPLEIWGEGQARRDALYVKDAARAVEAAIKSPHARGLYLIGSGAGRTVADEVQVFAEVFGTPERPLAIVRRPEIADKKKSYYFDISKARAELGWQPIYDFARILKDYDREVAAGRFAPPGARDRPTPESRLP
jgi:UDP-glucose 4-epimerase